MSEVPGGGRRLPDDAFASHARRPNPSHDEHVAFPDASDQGPATGSLPSSAWARPPQPTHPKLPPELSHVPPEVTALLVSAAAHQRARRRSRGRLSPVGIGLAAVAGLALIMGSNSPVESFPPDQVAGQGDWHHEGVGGEGTVGGLDLVAVPEVADPTIQPVDQPRYEIPLGPSTVRIEVVTDDPAANIIVTSDSADAWVGEVDVPFGAELVLEERPDQLAVTARNRYGQTSIQCRVYAEGLLVSIATGVGLVECVAEPAR